MIDLYIFSLYIYNMTAIVKKIFVQTVSVTSPIPLAYIYVACCVYIKFNNPSNL